MSASFSHASKQRHCLFHDPLALACMVLDESGLLLRCVEEPEFGAVFVSPLLVVKKEIKRLLSTMQCTEEPDLRQTEPDIICLFIIEDEEHVMSITSSNRPFILCC